MAIDVADVTSVGRLFQALSQAMRNAGSPIVTSLARGRDSWSVVPVNWSLQTSDGTGSGIQNCLETTMLAVRHTSQGGIAVIQPRKDLNGDQRLVDS